jgi:CDP-glucose 4,6-dehydratase
LEELELSMSSLPQASFWKGKSVFVTGHTGFKGSWLSLWLHKMGAIVTGYSNEVPTSPSLFETANVGELITDIRGDVRDLNLLTSSLAASKAEVVLHLAAQPLVRDSYVNPVETYATNVMGTVHMLEAVRQTPQVKIAVIITTDKCYENKEWLYGYRENEPMGGYDPYSSSKGASELVVSAYTRSFFTNTHTTVVSARAGNVIGGGDWATDRLIPDIVQAFSKDQSVKIRNPLATRPWQHVLEPLSGYLVLAEKAYSSKGFEGAWNIGPHDIDARNVQWVTEEVAKVWGKANPWIKDDGYNPHEATYLKLDISKARTLLNWEPRWNVETAIEKTTTWYKNYYLNSNLIAEDIRALCIADIDNYSK